MRKLAILVVHGIGEQRPMDTLRGFARALLSASSRYPSFRSVPDRASELQELRCLRAHHGGPAGQQFHFFEYYWAHRVFETSWGHVASWMKSLLWRRSARVPPHLRGLHAAFWVAALFFALSLPFGLGGLLANVALVVDGSRWVGGLAFLLMALIQLVLLEIVGDAARYLSRSPSSIALRHEIRSEGIKLLKALHTADYDEIVVVGHSLGSVIAYDMLRSLWTELGGYYDGPKPHAQPALAALESSGTTAANVDAYHTLQRALFEEETRAKSRWRVSQLITLGSPLAHAAILLASDAADLTMLQAERELPRCPPVVDRVPGATSVRFSYDWADPTCPAGHYKQLHHAAVFAVVRWTNLYFPVSLGVAGDVVGGPLRDTFGSGIRDVPVTTPFLGGLLDRTPLSHTRYWDDPHARARAAADVASIDAEREWAHAASAPGDAARRQAADEAAKKMDDAIAAVVEARTKARAGPRDSLRTLVGAILP